MKLSEHHRILLIILLFLMSTTMASAQKRTQSEGDARRELDALTSAHKPPTTRSNILNTGEGTIEHESVVKKAGHSFTHIKWSHVKKQAARVGLTAARIAQSSGYLPVVPRLSQEIPPQSSPAMPPAPAPK